MMAFAADIALRWAGLPPAVRAFLRIAGIALVAVLAVVIVDRWHDGRIAALTREAKAAGRAEQAAADRAAVIAATTAARDAQARLVAASRATGARINKDISDAHAVDAADLARRYDAFRLSWRRHTAAAHPGGAGQGAAAGIPAPAPGAGDAACHAAGWVDIETATTLAEAADTTAAQVNGLLDWHAAQAAAWPKPETPSPIGLLPPDPEAP